MNERALTLDDQLCFALYAASNAVVRAYRGRLDALGLTYPQYLVMLVLWQDGPQKMRWIAERLLLPPNAITPLVDRLEKAGLVRRAPDAKDRRAVWVELTERGRELHDASSRAQQEVECATGLDRDALVHLREELKALVERMEGMRTPG